MGKWTKLEGQFPDKPVKAESPERQLAITAGLSSWGKVSLSDTAARLLELKAAKDQIAKAEKDVNLAIEVIEKSFNYKLKELDIDSVVMLGYKFTAKPEPYASVTNKAEFLAWAHEHMKDNLDIHWQTLNATVKAILESETPTDFPPGVDVYLKRGIHPTKQKE